MDEIMKLQIACGFKYEEKETKVNVEHVKEMLQLDKWRKYTRAKKYGDQVILSEGYYVCPQCGKRLPAYSDFWKKTDMTSSDHSDSFFRSFNELVSAEECNIIINTPFPQETRLSCFFCGYKGTVSEQQRNILISTKEDKIIIACELCDVKELFALIWLPDSATIDIQYDIYEILCFDFQKGKTKIGVSVDKKVKYHCEIDDSTQLKGPVEEEDDPIYSLLKHHPEIKQLLIKAFLQTNHISKTIIDPNLDDFINRTKFIGYPDSFYWYLPVNLEKGSKNRLEDSFLEMAYRMHQYEALSSIYFQSALPESTELLHFLQNNPVLFFYLNEMEKLWQLLPNMVLFMNLLCSHNLYQIFILLRSYTYLFTIWSKFRDQNGNERLFYKLQDNLKNHSSTRNLDFSASFSVPILSNQDFIKDITIDGFEFHQVRSTKEYRSICNLFQYRIDERDYERGNYFIVIMYQNFIVGAVRIEKNVIVETFINFKDGKNIKQNIDTIYQKWCQLYQLKALPYVWKRKKEPRLLQVIPFDPVQTERFALKLIFENSDIKKYVLPIDKNTEDQFAATYKEYCFPDEIWSSVQLIRASEMPTSIFCSYGDLLRFNNGFTLFVRDCYEESTPYYEPELCNTIVYRDNETQLRKIWKWNVENVKHDFYIEQEGDWNHILHFYLPTKEKNKTTKNVSITLSGKRANSLDFDYIDNLYEDRSIVFRSGYGFGYVDEEMKIVIPMKYDWACLFFDGKAKVLKGNTWLFVNKNGIEEYYPNLIIGMKYQDISIIGDNLYSVASAVKKRGRYLSDGIDEKKSEQFWLRNFKNRYGTLDFTPPLMNYLPSQVRDMKDVWVSISYDSRMHKDVEKISLGNHFNEDSLWGLVDEAGNELVSPQYSNIEDFFYGLAIACKKEKQYDGLRKRVKETWGVINKNGEEVIPIQYDLILRMEYPDDFHKKELYIVRFNGKEGIMNSEGKWVANPIFHKIFPWKFFNGMIVVKDKNGDYGIYDTEKNSWVVEPPVIDQLFCDTGEFAVKKYDKKLDRTIMSLYDRNKVEKYRLNDTSFFGYWNHYYIVGTLINKKTMYGLLHDTGEMCIPYQFENLKLCVDIQYDDIFYKEVAEEEYVYDNILIFTRNGKKGVCNLSGEIIVEAKYDYIYGVFGLFLIIAIKENDQNLYGIITLNGETVIPLGYEKITSYHKEMVLCEKKDCFEMFQLEKIHNDIIQDENNKI